MLPRQLAFGPVGSQLQASTLAKKSSTCLQQNSPQAIPQEQAMSASYLQPNSPQAIPNQQTLGVPMSASYRTLHAFPSAAPGSLGCSPSTFSVFQFR